MICTTTGRQCTKEYPLPLKSDWSDSEEEEKGTNEQNKEEEIEDGVSDLQHQKEIKDQELKNNNTKTPNKAQNPHPHQTLKTQEHLLLSPFL